MTSGTPGISGTVRWRDGAGTAGATVTVTDLDGRQHGRTGTDPDGGYVVGLPTGGTYLVVVAVDGTPPQAALVGVAATPVRHDVTLAGGATLNGTLVDAAGRPVPRAALALIDPRGDVVATGGPDPQGRFRLVAPGAGSYTLTVTAPGHRPVARTGAVVLALHDAELRALPWAAHGCGSLRIISVRFLVFVLSAA